MRQSLTDQQRKCKKKQCLLSPRPPPSPHQDGEAFILRTRDDYGKAGPFSVERLHNGPAFCELFCVHKHAHSEVPALLVGGSLVKNDVCTNKTKANLKVQQATGSFSRVFRCGARPAGYWAPAGRPGIASASGAARRRQLERWRRRRRRRRRHSRGTGRREPTVRDVIRLE